MEDGSQVPGGKPALTTMESLPETAAVNGALASYQYDATVSKTQQKKISPAKNQNIPKFKRPIVCYLLFKNILIHLLFISIMHTICKIIL